METWLTPYLYINTHSQQQMYVNTEYANICTLGVLHVDLRRCWCRFFPKTLWEQPPGRFLCPSPSGSRSGRLHRPAPHQTPHEDTPRCSVKCEPDCTHIPRCQRSHRPLSANKDFLHIVKWFKMLCKLMSQSTWAFSCCAAVSNLEYE